MYALIALVLLFVFFLSAALRILNEYERGVIFRLGRVIAAKGPGLIILIPVIGVISGVFPDLVMHFVGIDLSSRGLAEH